MPWPKGQKLIQLPVKPDLRKKIDGLAKEDDRSLTAECIHLLKQGITRRENMLALVAAQERSARGPSTSRRNPPAAKTGS